MTLSAEEKQQEGKKEKIVVGNLFERLPVLAASASTALYVLGFIVVTSYLATNGIYDQSLLSTKYILAGALTAVVMLTYYFFVWRKVVERIQSGVRWHQKLTEPMRGFLDVYYVVEHVFGCCFAALMLLTILGHHEYSPIQISVFLAFCIDFVLIKFGGYKHFPRVCFSISFILNSAAISLCLLFGYFYQPLLSLIMVFLTITLTGSLVMTSIGWRSGEDKHYGVFYIALYVVLGVIGFGATVFDQISPKYGGAQPANVAVYLAADADDEIKKLFKSNEGKTFMVLETSDSSTFRLGTAEEKPNFVKLERGLVKGVVFQPPQETSDDKKRGQSLRDAIEGLLKHFSASNEKG